MAQKAELDVEVLINRPDSLFVTDGDVSVWVPKSLIHNDSEIDEDSEEGECGTLIIPQWKAEELGMI